MQMFFFSKVHPACHNIAIGIGYSSGKKGSDQTICMRRLVRALACGTYHTVGNLMSWLINDIWTFLLLFREMLRPAITDIICFGAKSTGVVFFTKRLISKISSNSQHQEVVSHYILKERTYTFCLCAFL